MYVITCLLKTYYLKLTYCLTKSTKLHSIKIEIMQYNFLLVAAITALVPIIIGSIWYNPNVFGSTWIKINSLDQSKEKINMPLVLGLTYIFGFFICIILSGIVIHQMGFLSMLQNHFSEPAIQKLFEDVMSTSTLATDFRTFKHGALHGGLTGIGFALPIIAINAMFERRGYKYIAIHSGYWIFVLIIMGGILCQFVDLKTMG